ncbi:DUF4837 family protein [Leptobacterium flavescens]|uniref:DUF4837 family protein n=1 Tax=Leptobacterium flavescens TaxID=472055 RepID=A0A6P0UJW9_9FLAO|nr:DUF4837 family protein [Leptobacterium flavescens]NER13267.1 DUF4837 family protein [Leptobacterium flavescens]
MKKILWIALVATFFFSCKKGTDEKYLPDSVGAINTLAVVIDNEMWKGKVGDEIRKYFAAPVDGLPWDEPLFSIHQMPPVVFDGFARNSRNIIVVQKEVEPGSGISEDPYAQPQKVAFFKGETDDDIIELIQKGAPKVIRTFKDHELKENVKRMKRSLNKETVLKEKLGISMTMPSVYKVAKQEEDFVWIRRELTKGHMNILAYELPLNGIPNDSTKVEAIIKMRDSIGERYIPGREEGMYMITEKAYAPYVFNASIAGRTSTETKGMWEVKNFFMAGPFINYIVEDKPNGRLLVIEGFTFAPSTNKRDYMFELETILKSLRFEES